MRKTFKEQEREKLIEAATNEIFGSISYTDTGNYWINNRWNLFCEKGYVSSGGEIRAKYYCISLEEYDGAEKCIDCQRDLQETTNMTEKELEFAVRAIVERSEHLWLETNTQEHAMRAENLYPLDMDILNATKGIGELNV